MTSLHEYATKSFAQDGVQVHFCKCTTIHQKVICKPPKLEVYARVVQNTTSLLEYATLSFAHDGVQVHF